MNHAGICEEAGTKTPPVVAKLAGEKWRALPEKKKKPFKKVAAEQKAKWRVLGDNIDRIEKELKTSCYKEVAADVKEKYQKEAEELHWRMCYAGLKKKKKDLAEEAAPAESGETQEGLEKPPTAYWQHWLSSEKSRAAISCEELLAKFTEENWKAFSEAAEVLAEKQAARLAKMEAERQKSKKSKQEPDAKRARKPRAPGAYWLWLADNCKRIGKEIGFKAGPAISKEAGK
eukprot:4924722-Amphidinium_carterae.1